MNSLWRNTLLYGLGAALSRGLQILLLPLYTRYLAPADYGGLEMLQIVASILSVVFGLMISSGFVRSFYDNTDETKRALLLGSALAFTFASILIVLVPIVAWSGPLAAQLNLGESGRIWLVATALTNGLMVLSRSCYNELMVRERVVHYITTSLMALFVALACSIWFVAGLKLGVTGVIAAQLVGALVEWIILKWVVIRTVSLAWSQAAIKDMLAFSVPLMPLQAAALLLLVSDRFFLSRYLSLEQVGYYAVACRFAGIVVLCVVEPMRAFGPHIFSMIDDPVRCRQALADMSRYVLGAGVCISLALALFSSELIHVVAGSGYSSGASVVFLLCITQALYAFFNVACFALNIVRKNAFISAAWVVAATLSIAANMWAIPRFGMVAAACTVCGLHAIVCLAILLYVARVYPVPFAYARLITLLLLSIVTYLVGGYLPWGGHAVLSKVGLFITFGAVLSATGYLSGTEWRALARVATSWWGYRQSHGSRS